MGPIAAGFAAGGVCASHGVCVNSSRYPNLLLCKCDEWYSGASDFFDSRVEQMHDGTWLSFSCHSSLIGTYIMWSIWSLFGLLRVVQLLPLWVRLCKRHYNDPKKTADGYLYDSPLRIVSIDLFVVVPFFATGFSKLGGMTFGSDAAATIFLAMTIFSFQMGTFELTRTEFNIFVLGSKNQEEAAKARKLRMFLKCCGLLVFFCLTIIPSLSAIAFDKSAGPIVNNEYIVIYLRNLGALAYGILDMVTTWMIRQRVRKLLSFSSTVGNMNNSKSNSNSNTSETSVASLLIKKMDEEMRAYIVFLATVGVTYSVFCISYLLPFQTYSIAIIMSLGALRHSAKAFTNEKESSRPNVNSKLERTQKGGNRTTDARQDGSVSVKQKRGLGVTVVAGRSESFIPVNSQMDAKHQDKYQDTSDSSRPHLVAQDSSIRTHNQVAMERVSESARQSISSLVVDA